MDPKVTIQNLHEAGIDGDSEKAVEAFLGNTQGGGWGACLNYGKGEAS